MLVICLFVALATVLQMKGIGNGKKRVELVAPHCVTQLASVSEKHYLEPLTPIGGRKLMTGLIALKLKRINCRPSQKSESIEGVEPKLVAMHFSI